MDGENTASGGDWSTWIQNIAGGVITKASEAKWVQPYEVEQMRLKALGQAGLGYYTEGQRTGVPVAGSVGGISPTVLMVAGVAVVALLLLKR